MRSNAQIRIFNKVVAIILCVALMLGLAPEFSRVAKAAYTEVALSVGTGGLHAQDSANRYLLYFSTGSFDVNTLNVAAVWGNNTILIDGEPVKSSNTKNDVNFHVLEDQLVLTVDYSLFGSGVTAASAIGEHLIVIPKGTVIGDAIVIAEDMGIKVAGYQVQQENLNLEYVEITPIAPHEPAATGFCFETGGKTDDLPYSASWDKRYNFETGGVYYNGTDASNLTKAFLIKITNDRYFIAFDNCGITFKTGDVVILDGTVRRGDVCVKYTRTAFSYDGANWKIFEEGVLNFTNTNGGAWQGNRWLTFLSSRESVPAESTYIGQGLSIEVQCEKTVTTYALQPDHLIVVDGQWALLLPPDNYPTIPSAEDTKGKSFIVTLKAGEGIDAEGNSWAVKSDTSILYSDEEVKGIIIGENKGLVTAVADKGGTAGVYFDISAQDGFAYSDAWDVRPIIAAANITIDGKKLTTSADSLIKIGPTSYYFSLHPSETSGVPETLSVGSEIVFDFYATETATSGQALRFSKTTFRLTDSGWVQKALLGDANGDEQLTLGDIVRLKKYFYDGRSEINKVSADANQSGRVDEKDIYTVQEYLFENAIFWSGMENSHAVIGMPYYADDTEIPLGAYFGPRAAGGTDYTYTSGGTITSEYNETNYINAVEFERYANSGLNTLIHESDAFYASANTGLGAGVNSRMFQTYMELAYKQGLEVYVTSQGLNSYLKQESTGRSPVGIDFNEDGNLYDDEGNVDIGTVNEVSAGWDYNGNGVLETNASASELFYYNDNITDGNGKTILEADIEEVLDFVLEKGYDNFKGFVMADELYAAAIDNYRTAVAIIKKEAAERGMSINVFHSQHPSSAEGAKDSYKNYYIPVDGYEEYINNFGLAAGTLTYDRYPLLRKKTRTATGYVMEETLDTEWLTNLETVATLGKESGFKTGITVQSCGYEFKRNLSVGNSVNYWRNPVSDADMQFQIYTALAYGMKSINYYTYWEYMNQSTTWYTGCMVEYGGTVGKETDIYTYVQHANEEIKRFDHVFLDYNWKETLDSSKAADVDGRIKEWSQTSDTIVGCMYDAQKQLDGFWLVNASDPFYGESKKISISFNDVSQILVFKDGVQSVVPLIEGVYQTTLSSGEGQFVILLK